MYIARGRFAHHLWAATACIVALVLAPTMAIAAPRLSFIYNDVRDNFYKQDLATGATTAAGLGGSTYVHWGPKQRYALIIGGRWDGSYEWVNPAVLDSWTGREVTVSDESGFPFPEETGVVTFGGWSADGTRFAVVISSLWVDDLVVPRVYIFDTASARALGSVTCTQMSNAALSPDGSRVVYSYGSDFANTLWMYDASAGTDDLWMDASELGTGSDGSARPFWPSGGGQIIVNVDQATRRSMGVLAVDEQTKVAHSVESLAGWICDLTPDGRYALIESQSGDRAIGQYQMGCLNIQTGLMKWVLSVSEMAQCQPIRSATLSPDGAWVLLEKMYDDPGIPSEIWRIKADGSSRTLVASGVNPAFRTDEFAPNPYGWSVRNGSDTYREDDWVIWQRVFGDSVPMPLNTSGKGLFDGGNCRGFAGSALANYVEGGVALAGVLQQPPGFGLWSALSFSPSDASGYPRFVWSTEAAILDRVETFQLLQSFYVDMPHRAGAAAAAAEAVRRVDAGEPPIVLGISANGHGHALVPFRYERDGGYIHLYVYDCNWPGATTRYININATTGAWTYTLWQGEDWSAGDSSINWSTYEDLAAVAPSSATAGAQVRVAGVSGRLPEPVLSASNARVLAFDSSGRRLGYVGPALLSEIPGAAPDYPDATDPSGIVRRFSFGAGSLVRTDITPIESGPWSMGANDADSAISVESSGQAGATGCVTLTPSLGSVSFAPRDGVSTVTMWAGSWADGGKVQYGVIEATTTASDLRLSATSAQGRVENLSSAPKSVTLAVLGAGWVGRKIAKVVIPAGGYVDFAATSETAVNAAGMTAGLNGASLAATSSVVYGTSRVALAPTPPTVSYLSATTIRAQTAESALPASQLRLEVSYDGGRHWASLGSFTSRSSDGYLVKSVKLSRNCSLRARVLGSSTRVGSTSASVVIGVRASLTTPSTTTTQRYGRSYTISGYLKPRHTSGSRAVRAYCYRLESGRWVYHKSVTLSIRNYSSYSKYSGSLRLTAKGKWRVRVYHSDSTHSPTYSSYRYVTVK